MNSEKRPLRVAMIGLPRVGGSAVVAAELSELLRRAGHDVTLLSHGAAAAAVVRSYRGATRALDLPGYEALDAPPETLGMLNALMLLDEQAPIDVVHLHYAVPHVVSIVLFAQFQATRRVRTVVTLHGTDVTHLGTMPEYRTAFARTLALVDRVTVPSRWLRDEVVDRISGTLQPSIAVVPNFVDSDRFRPVTTREPARPSTLDGIPRAASLLVHVSNFRPVKQTDQLVPMLKRLRESIDVYLVCLGDGPERPSVQRAFEAEGLGPFVRFDTTGLSVELVLPHATVFVLPSAVESFGLAALEAMSCGVPVVAYRTGGLPEVIPQACGSLVDLNDQGGFVRAVIDWCRPERRLPAADAARERTLSVYRPEQALDRYLGIYRDATSIE